MMSDILLAKTKLGPGWIDLGIGESHLIREAALSTYSISTNKLNDSLSWEYPAPEGDAELVEILSRRHNAPVVITTGAKQGLGACFYALKKLGCQSVGMRSPYWALIPPLVKFHGLEPIPSYDADSCLAVLPGNPDGYMMRPEEIQNFVKDCSAKNKYLIHDAVYHSHSYLPEETELLSFGDVQLYSASKMWGLSGIRIGYAVCHNEKFYGLIREYVEMMTVGVSEISQQFFLQNIIKPEEERPAIRKKFERKAFYALKEARKLFSQIDSSIIELPDDFEETAGMFVWAKLKDADKLREVKINGIEGTPFGVPGHIRLNLAVSRKTLEEVMDRLS
jgi:aspartate/methionine/tyrosine aminotransferase